MSIKPIYTFTDMIDYFSRKGITSTKTPAEIQRILESSNYFYKLTSYRKNFLKKPDGKYINLSFELLSDMASLDMQLRYLVLRMCLDIEHKLKTVILAEITNNPSENGYSIIDQYIATSDDPTRTKKQLLGSAKYSKYNKPLYDKYKDRPPVWVVFETMQFGELVNFINFYIENNSNSQFAYLYKKLYFVKNIRNTAAHSSSLLNVITGSREFENPSKFVTEYVYNKPKISKYSARNKISNMRIHDLTVLYIVYDKLIQPGKMKNARKREIKEFLIRAKREATIYKKHNQINSVFSYFVKLTL